MKSMHRLLLMSVVVVANTWAASPTEELEKQLLNQMCSPDVVQVENALIMIKEQSLSSPNIIQSLYEMLDDPRPGRRVARDVIGHSPSGHAYVALSKISGFTPSQPSLLFEESKAELKAFIRSNLSSDFVRPPQVQTTLVEKEGAFFLVLTFKNEGGQAYRLPTDLVTRIHWLAWWFKEEGDAMPLKDVNPTVLTFDGAKKSPEAALKELEQGKLLSLGAHGELKFEIPLDQVLGGIKQEPPKGFQLMVQAQLKGVIVGKDSLALSEKLRLFETILYSKRILYRDRKWSIY